MGTSCSGSCRTLPMTAMWAAQPETGDVELACRRLLKEFDTDQETLSRDLERFVERLAAQGLLLVGDDALAATPPDPPS